ncbi:MAG: hypothetical protein P8O09_02425, partial [Flavobacteriaceae bacterium]|nr:hypothetical protein [Flavobacteriaceae bacterium]
SNKPISIFDYRNKIQIINIGDYLMVTVNDGVVELPKINEKKKIKKNEPKNMYSTVRKEKERLRREKLENERLRREKLENERLRREKEQLEREKLENEEAELKVKKTDVDNSKNNKTQRKIIIPNGSKNKSVDTIKKKKTKEKEEDKKKKKEDIKNKKKDKKKRATRIGMFNKK